MLIRVDLFARLKEALGQDALTVDINLPCRAHEFKQAVLQEISQVHYGVFSHPNNRLVVDHVLLSDDTLIREGEYFALIPPITGG